MYLASQSKDVGFHRYHKDCEGGVGNVMTCRECQAVVTTDDIVSGLEVDGKLVIVTDDEKASLAAEKDGAIEVVQFIEEDEVDLILLEAPYYVEPEGNPEGYALLRHVMSESGRVAIVRYTPRTRTTLGVLRVHRRHADDPLDDVA